VARRSELVVGHVPARTARVIKINPTAVKRTPLLT
jgi:hypothetical protein